MVASFFNRLFTPYVPPAGGASLDFTQASNSQYIAAIF